MVDLVTIRRGNALVPASPLDLQQLTKLREGRPHRAEITYSRSVLHNRWYRGLVSIVADGLGVPPDALHAELKFKAGLVRGFFMVGEAHLVDLESTAFRAMDETRFTEFVSLAIEILFRDYLPGVKRDNVFRQVEEMVGPRP